MKFPSLYSTTPCASLRNLIAWLWLAAIACVSLHAGAETVLADLPPQYAIKNWTASDGLPQNTVQALAQTPDGYLWIGTQAGLVRFDGIRFSQADAHYSLALASANIRALMVDRQGAMWIGTDGGGLARMSQGVVTRFTTSDGLTSNRITGMCEDSDGSLWIATYGGGLNRLVRNKFTSYTQSSGLPSDQVRTVACDNIGSVLIGTEHGFSELREGRITPYPATKELRISTLLHDATGTLWFGTQYGISSWVDNEIKNISNTSKAVGHNVKTLIKDKAGYVWIGGRDGLSRGSRNLSAGIDWRAPIPPEAVVNTLFEDREGNLWAGTQVDGLFRLRSAPVHMITSADGLLDREIGLVLQDSSDGFWIGTKRGLNYMRDGKIVNYTVREGLSDNYIRALAEDPAGGMWVGTFSNGLTRLNGSIVSQLGPKEGLHDGRIGAVHTDRQGALWIGTMNGLVRRQQAQFSLFSRREGLSDEAITALTEDKQGALWIGTFNGLNRLVDGKITTVPISTGSTAALILTLHSGADGSLWVGTMGLGLIRLRQGVVTRFDKSDGLPDNTISQILEDDSGALWLGSNRGIFRLDPAQLDGYTRNQGKNLAVRLFDEHDGMANRECASNGQPAAWKARDGSLWFATIRGVAVIDPRRITSNPLPPPVLLEQVVVDHREVSMKGALKLPPTTSNIEFHYTATSLVAPDNNKFKYRLIGFDPDWVYADQRRVAYYTNLPPGEYSFRALASNSDGVWNDIGATLPFTIKPYFFQKPWFVGLCVLIILLGGLGAYWIYIYNLRKRQALRAEREKMSRDLHDNLSQTMTGLLLQLDTARDIIINEPQAGLPYVDRAIELARDGIRETRNILLRLRSPKFERRSTDLVNALRRNLMRMTIGTPVRIDITQSGRQSTLPAELELELFRVTQEAVTNALRHGAATNIKVELIYRSDSVTLTVADDGHGFDPLQAPTVPGIGLGGIGERIAGLAGTLDIDSSPGKGTRVTVCIPLREVPA